MSSATIEIPLRTPLLHALLIIGLPLCVLIAGAVITSAAFQGEAAAIAAVATDPPAPR